MQCACLGARWWGRLWQRWQDDPVRKTTNDRFANDDALATRTASRMMLIFLLTKTCWQERLIGLALAASTHSVFGEVIAYLSLSKRATYLRHRELLLTAFTMHITWTVKHLVLNGGLNIYGLHAGSPLLLLILLQICHALWMCLYMVHHRLSAKWNYVALPLLSLLPLWNSRPVCRRVLEAPGVQAPLLELYTLLGLSHSTVASPAALAPVWDTCTPFQQCLVVNAWSVLVFGVVLPLVVARQLDRRPSAPTQDQQRREQQQEGWLLEGEQDEQQEPLARHPGASVADALLGSCLMWVVSVMGVLNVFPSEA